VTYDETLSYLFALEATRGWDLKLERVRAALERLGSPHLRYPSVLIAGTNGKGSTAAMVEAAERAAGRRVGFYSSPHLVNFTERIRVHGEELARERVVGGVAEIRARIEPAQIALTFFEMATVLAFRAFAEDEVELAVLEVGLGGRLDATNVAEPLVSAVTSIGFDHQEYLGSSLDAIAREKAGVMRAGRPVVLGAGLAEEARAALLDEARCKDACPVLTSPADVAGWPLGLLGEHMRGNAAVAVRVVRLAGTLAPELAVDEPTLRTSLARVRWPGRLDVLGRDPLVICDGAHNREGVEALVAALPGLLGGRKARLLFGALRDKPWRDMARALRPFVTQAWLATVGGSRGVPAEELRAEFAREVPAETVADPARTLARLYEADRETPILIAGSLYLVGAVYADLLERRHAHSVFALEPETRIRSSCVEGRGSQVDASQAGRSR